MFDVNKLKEGDEVAFVEYKGNTPCKAIVLGFNDHPQRKFKLSVNYDYHALNTDPLNVKGKWDERDVPAVTIIGHWWEHEKKVNKNKKGAKTREDNYQRIVAKAEVIKKELDARGIKYRHDLTEFTVSAEDLETLLGIRCFPRPA